MSAAFSNRLRPIDRSSMATPETRRSRNVTRAIAEKPGRQATPTVLASLLHELRAQGERA